MKRRVLGILLCLVMTLVMVPGEAFAAETTASGTWGDNLTWTLDSEGTLKIEGIGKMDGDSLPSWLKHSDAIKAAEIDDGVTNIGANAFWKCKELESVTMPDSVTSIDYMAFCECDNLKDVNIPANVTIIADFGFNGCQSIESITIPAKVTSIGAMAFNCCYNLKSIIFAGDTPPTIDQIAFREDTATAYYPANNETWKNAIDNGYGGNYSGALKWETSHLMHARGIFPGEEPTCAKTGLTDGEICLDCHEVSIEREVIPAKGHKYVWMDNNEEATCCKTGIKEGAICKVCGEVLIEAKELPINPNNHKNIVVDKSVKATSTKTGLTQGSHCADCGKVIKKQTITLAKPVLTSGTKNIAKKKIVVKWKKNSTCTGYQVKYVTGSTTKTVKVTGKSTLSKTLKSLKKGKTYKVYVRCYKKVGSSTYYSAYSTCKSVKVVK